MAVTTFFRAEALTTESKTNFIRDAWNRLERVPGGKLLYSRMVGRLAPYTGSMGAVVQELERRVLPNHAGGPQGGAKPPVVHPRGRTGEPGRDDGELALGYSLPDDARFIVAGMGLDYVKKARGTITGECRTPPIDSSAKQEYQINVTLRDEGGDVVVEGTLRTLVGPKQR